MSKQLKAELDKAYNERHALYKQLASLPQPGSENYAGIRLINAGARPHRPRPHYLERGSSPSVLRPAGKDAPMPGRQTRMAQHHISARKGSGPRAAARSAPPANPRLGSFRLAKLQT